MLKNKLINAIPLLVTVLIILSVLYALDMLKPEAEKKEYKAKKLKVFVEQTTQKETQLYAYSQGEVMPKQQVEVKSQVEGRIVYLSPNLVTGGRVKQGQVLLKIDNSDYALQVIQREARVAQAKQLLEKVKAQARIAKQELADLGRNNANDLARWLPQLNHAEAEVKAAKAQLDEAKLDLSRTEVIAPFDGVVRKESVNIEQHVGRNGYLATLYATDIMEVSLALNGKQLEILELPIDYYNEHYDNGIAVELSTEFGGKTLVWPAKVMRTEGQFDTRTRTLNIVAEIHQHQNEQQIIPGLFVNAKISGKTIPQATTLPRTTVRPQNRVWYVDNNDMLQVKVIEQVYRNNDVVVVTGLSNETRVITSALLAPTPGTLVKAIKQKPVKVVKAKMKDNNL